MRCKICGTKSFADLKCAIDSGADAVGFIVGTTYVTEDSVTSRDAAAMVKTLPPFIEPVCVTHLSDVSDLIDIVRETNCTTLQIQNDLAPEKISEIYEEVPYIKIVKAVHVMDESAIFSAKVFEKVCDAIILDTRTDDRIGGTGKTHDWSISKKIVEEVSVPVILAGGLNPENVRKAISIVRPYAVDVHTGVKKDGIRDYMKTKKFIQAARSTSSR